MKELQGLMTIVKEEAEKTRDLFKEKASNEAKIKEIICRNVKTVCDDFLKDINSFLALVYKLTGYEICPSVDGLGYTIDISDGCRIRVTPYPQSFCLDFVWTRVSFTEIISDRLEDKVSSKNIIPLFDYFGTEEKAQKTMQDYVYPVVKGLLDRWQKALVIKNSILEVQIEKLKEKLDNASVITESEDGSVEIHLGGKTYTAVLKEGE